MMYKIEDHVDLGLKTIQEGGVLIMDSPGMFSVGSRWTRLLLPRLSSSWEKTFAIKLIEYLDRLECIPVRFSLSAGGASQEHNFSEVLRFAEGIEELVKDPSVRAGLKQRIFALKYRLGAPNKGWSPSSLQPDIFNDLHKLAADWVTANPLLLDKALIVPLLKKLELCSCYTEFSELLLIDTTLRESFFSWALRDNNSVEAFILFPAMCKKLVECNLSGRIGRLGGRALAIKRIPLPDKSAIELLLTLQVEGRFINILDDEALIMMQGHYKLFVKDLFEIFRNKTVKVGNLEFFSDGIKNWNVHYHGYFDADLGKLVQIDLDEPLWWNQLPVFEVITDEEAVRRYGKHMDGKMWNAAASASRGTPTLNYEETHAYLEVAIPIGNGNYAVYDFGKFSYKFPENNLEKLSMFAENLHATVAYPDENVYYTHRQHVSHSFPLMPQEGFKLMEQIKADLIRARGMNLVYQIESENCAKWLHEKIEHVLGKKRVPNLFQMPLLKAEPTGFMKLAFRLLNKIPEKYRNSAFMFLHLPFAPFRGAWVREGEKEIYKSLVDHEFWQTGVVYLPSFLHHQKLKTANSMATTHHR